MAAYAAMISLKNTIQRIIQSRRISLVSPSLQILKPAYEILEHFQLVLVALDLWNMYSQSRKKVNQLDERIKEAVWEFEDLLESHLSLEILSQLQASPDLSSFSVDLQTLRHRVDCFADTGRIMMAEYIDELMNMPEEEGESISSRIDFGGIKSKMVRLSDHFAKARDFLIQEYHCSLVGMAGIGKTTLAKHIFEDALIRRHFEFRAWVKMGRMYEFNQILRCILAQVDPNTYHKMLTQRDDDDDDDDEKLVGLLKERFKGKKCLIVLDDVWDTRKLLLDLLLDKRNGTIRFLLTSRLRITSLDEHDASTVIKHQKLRFLNEEESEELLGEKVFGEKSFPSELDKLGKKIAKNCDGLPLMIVTVAELLSKADKTPKHWTEVAKQHSSLFEDAYNQISEVLYPSYDYLAQHLKMFFLYIGAFPRYHVIRPKKLINMFSAEGFLELNGRKIEDVMEMYLSLLAKWHLVQGPTREALTFESQERRRFPFRSLQEDIDEASRIGTVHSCWQHLCKEEGRKTKFLHVLKGTDDAIEDCRRLCAHSNMLFAFKQVCGSIRTDCGSTTRSLLCFGPYHQYPVPIHDMGFKLLRILDALKLRFYHFPIEILKLVCLQYLALTCNGELPASIPNLIHLQYLIIHRHINIRTRGAQSYMPVQIWDVQELKHIEILGSDLTNPNSDATLDKLSTLVGVSAKSCTREVLKRIPNLRKLGIQVELKPYDDGDGNPLSDLDCISQLKNLEKLKCCVVNPEMKYELSSTPLITLSMFPSSLIKLHLSGLGYPWIYMNDIGALLPNLQSLKLQCYAFRGPEWEIESGQFMKVEILEIEDTDLVRWKPRHGSFPKLKLLNMKHCYKIQRIDWPADHCGIKVIQFDNCNPLVVTYARRRRESDIPRVAIDSSF